MPTGTLTCTVSWCIIGVLAPWAQVPPPHSVTVTDYTRREAGNGESRGFWGDCPWLSGFQPGTHLHPDIAASWWSGPEAETVSRGPELSCRMRPSAV